MKKILLLCVATLFQFVAKSQNFTDYINSVFPVQNTVTTNYPEFTAVNVTQSYEYLGKNIFLASLLYLFKGEEHYLGCGIGNINQEEEGDYGAFISFSYCTKKDAENNGPWNSSTTTTQFAFHPGGIKDSRIADYRNSEHPYYTPLYAFTYSDSKGLNLVNLQSATVIAHLGEGGDVTKYAYLSVLAGKDRNIEDIIVVAGKGNFKIWGTIPQDGSSVRAISVSDTSINKLSFYDLSGKKHKKTRRGVNIIVDGKTSKRVLSK